MKTHGMTFRDDMALAIRKGVKNQTRRPMDPQPSYAGGAWKWNGHSLQRGHVSKAVLAKCPWQVGDRIFVQEEWSTVIIGESMGYNAGEMVIYRDASDLDVKWEPAKSMPSRIARTWLEITEIRAQRILDISADDAVAEGVECHWDDGVPYYGPLNVGHAHAPYEFFILWDSIYGQGAASLNPWVWAYTFKEVKGGAV